MISVELGGEGDLKNQVKKLFKNSKMFVIKV